MRRGQRTFWPDRRSTDIPVIERAQYSIGRHADRQGVDISVTVCLFFKILYGYGFFRPG